MEIKNSFDIPLPPDKAWDVLMDIPRIAPCMPGATLLGQAEDGSYQGKVSVNLGPIALSFKGTASFIERDAAAQRAKLNAKGSDQRGRGAASGVVTFQLSPKTVGSRVDVLTDVTLTGLVAQYGRGAGVIQGVATEICNQFASNLRNLINAEGATEAVSAEKIQGPAGPPFVPAAKPIAGIPLFLKVLCQNVKGLFSRA